MRDPRRSPPPAAACTTHRAHSGSLAATLRTVLTVAAVPLLNRPGGFFWVIGIRPENPSPRWRGGERIESAGKRAQPRVAPHPPSRFAISEKAQSFSHAYESQAFVGVSVTLLGRSAPTSCLLSSCCVRLTHSGTGERRVHSEDSRTTPYLQVTFFGTNAICPVLALSS